MQPLLLLLSSSSSEVVCSASALHTQTIILGYIDLHEAWRLACIKNASAFGLLQDLDSQLVPTVQRAEYDCVISAYIYISSYQLAIARKTC
jgi:hypothetical protein